MFMPRMNVIFRILFLLLSFTLPCVYGVFSYGQDQSPTEKPVSSTEHGSVQARSAERGAMQQSPGAKGWMLSDSAMASLLGAFISGLAYVLNRSIAYRTATIEAQKLLVEINKQYISCPKLLLIEENYNTSTITDEDFRAKLKAMVYLKLNVFEVIFATLPYGRVRNTWKAYFNESLDKCSLLGDELEAHGKIYHRDLIRAYNKWKGEKPEKTKTDVTTSPPRHHRRRKRNPR